jgi:PGF-CTERM protein
MERRQGITILITATLLLASVAGAGLVAAEDFPSATDGDLANGEVLKVAEDDDDQVKEINYTFVLSDNTPGAEVSARHFAVGLTENATLHRIKLYSEDIGYSNCEPDNTAAFGIDRGDDNSGTETDVSLLTSFKSYSSEQNFIDIKYYKEETLAGEPIGGSVYDQIVASQNGCYDNPSEPGWYRINGTITGSTNGDTTTDYKIRDLSNYFYICDCDSRAEAEETLGPAPNDEGSDGTGGDGGTDGDASTSTATDTATATATATPEPSRGSTSTATATASPTDAETPTATVTATATATATVTASATGTPDEVTPTATATPDAGPGARDTATAAQARATGQQPDNGARTPTIGDGPGFGLLSALVGVVALALLVRRN